MANKDEIIKLKGTASSDAEALAQIFESLALTDDGTVTGRLKGILAATEHRWVPGLQTGVDFHDSGFRADFKDPWPDSDNQVGHFLTAVGLSFNPAKVEQSFFGNKLRDWLTAPTSMPSQEVAMRLTIGHEKSADPPIRMLKILGAFVAFGAPEVLPEFVSLAAKIVMDAFRLQFLSTSASDLTVFADADSALGATSPLNLAAAKAKLLGITVDPTKYGNSYQDLLLSLYGWRLGQQIKAGKFTAKADVATWVRDNLM
jgi:hypothetical protein